jgi:type II secretory pathway pseudopilin PulG
LQRRAEHGMTLAEITIGTALLGLVAATALTCLTVLNKNAVSSRVLSNAREIVQRNLEAAVGCPFTPTIEPDILKITTSTGTPWDEAGGSSQVTIYTSRDGTEPILKGTLTRTVVAEANPPTNADIRRVKFHLDYTLFSRPLSYEMTTIRAIDQ